MKQFFWVLKECDEFYPMAFITPCDDTGKYRKDNYKLRDGEEIVKVEILEVKKNN